MDVHIEEISIEQKPVIERLMQLYLYDFSEIEGHEINRDGLFEYRYLDLYWIDSDRHPFLMYAEGKVAGFVLVNSITYLDENEGARSIAEFFVMRQYRRKGVGKKAAIAVFDMFPGRWEVRQTQNNIGGRKFWRSVIPDYTGGRFTQTIADTEEWQGPIQSFDNTGFERERKGN